MMGALKLMKLIWKWYSRLSVILITALICFSLVAFFSGYLSGERMHAARDALLGIPLPAPERKSPEPDLPESPPEVAKAAPAPSIPPRGILREIEQASLDLKMWEDRIDLLGRDIGKRLVTVGQKDQTIQEQQRAWDRVKKAMVPLLNQLLEGTPDWQPITEESFLSGLTGEAEETSGDQQGDARGPTLVDILERLRQREAAFAEGAKALQELDPKVLASILSAGLKPTSSSAFSGTGPAGVPRKGESNLTEEEAVRLLVSLDQSKLAKLFKSMADEDPTRAASLMSQVLKMAQKGEAKANGGENRG